MFAKNSIQGVQNVRQDPQITLGSLSINKNASEESALDDLYSVAASGKTKRSLLRKRNRVGKTPAEKINWTPDEVSLNFRF